MKRTLVGFSKMDLFNIGFLTFAWVVNLAIPPHGWGDIVVAPLVLLILACMVRDAIRTRRALASQPSTGRRGA